MCGIYCAISAKCYHELDADATVLLSRRGPDASSYHKVEVYAGHRTWYLTFVSSVLSLRGSQIQKQPVIDSCTGSILCWNGEAWLMDEHEIPENDTQAIFRQLINASQNHTALHTVARVLARVKGPFAFVYYDAIARRLYFGRDVLGRRSLLSNSLNLETNELTIASAAFSSRHLSLEEVRTPYIFSVDLNQPSLTLEDHPFESWSPTINKSLPDIALSTLPTDASIKSLLSQLNRAIRLRVQAIPTYAKLDATAVPSKVGILFSGGLDCTLLARLTHETLPSDEPIDLINVAFENPRVVNARASERLAELKNSDTYETCPDRLTGRSSFTELLEVCPTREWRFVAVNVPYKEFVDHRQTIVQLMFPHNTEMDLSITAALYFAARGQGEMSIISNMAAIPYTTTARVLLSGLGADELFAGYARHAAAFARGGFAALNDELELDYKRIGSRNLGRDDRVISHWARETRFPFIDEDLVEFALSLPSWEKCGFRLGKAFIKHFETRPTPECTEDLHPEKMLLRCALWQLGMRGAAAEKKRAIQFGARTAKMHTGKSKGTDLVA